MRKMPDLDELRASAEEELDYPDFRKQTNITAEAALGAVVVDAMLNRTLSTLVERPSNLIIVTVPDAAWAEIIGDALESRFRDVAVKSATERDRTGGIHHRVGSSELDWLQKKRTVIYVSQDPDEILDETVLASVDCRISAPALTPPLLRQAIRRVTGTLARGVTTAMTHLDVSIIASAIRPGLSSRACIRNLQRAVDRLTASKVSAVPRVSELPLTKEVRSWSSRLVDDLIAVEAGALTPEALVYTTLEGPPGTGKSLIAASVALSAGWAFVPATVGSWFTSGDGALGGVARNVRGFVDEVLASEPAIGFLDEVDALPNRATISHRGRDWWLPVITLFLTEIDRVRKSGKKVLLVAATNYYSRLDEALIRPGRLHQRVSVLPPQREEEVIALLKYYLRGDLADADLTQLARIGRGATPAQVEGWLGQARGAARATGRALTLEDILEQMIPKDDRPACDIEAIALHEIGHAIVAQSLGHAVESVSILQQGMFGGVTATLIPTLVPTWNDIMDIVCIKLGGRAADIEIGRGANAGAETDLASATQVLTSALVQYGLGDKLIHLPDISLTSPALGDEIDALLKAQLRRAQEIIRAHAGVARWLAERLMREKLLPGVTVSKALERSGTTKLSESTVDRSRPGDEATEVI